MLLLNLLMTLGLSFAADFCQDLFFASPVMSDLPVLMRHDFPFETSEILKHGQIVNLKDPAMVRSFQKQFQQDNGIYVFLLDRSGIMAIDKQSPTGPPFNNYAFHGTHRGLLKKRDEDFAYLGKADVIFAGEFLVMAGRMIWLSDASVYFYDVPQLQKRRDETDREYRMRLRRARELAIPSVRRRMERVITGLQSLGWADAKTLLKPTEKSAEDFDDGYRLSAHRQSRNVAFFEKTCRETPGCLDVFEKMRRQITEVERLNGWERLEKNMRVFLAQEARHTQSLIQFFSLIRDQGEMAVFSQHFDMATLQRSKALIDFEQAMDWFLINLNQAG